MQPIPDKTCDAFDYEPGTDEFEARNPDAAGDD